MKHFSTIWFLSFLYSIGYAQVPCDETSYLIPQSGDIIKSEIIYGSNVDFANQTVNLRADVYELEAEDDELRPLVILAHGGGFVFGDKADVGELCEVYARLGYVCASIQYRLYPIIPALFLDSAGVVDVAFQAISDMRGAVRHFKSGVDLGNPFQIDPNRIIVGGISAGAIMALHTGFLHEGDFIPEGFDDLIAANGGLEGNTGDSLNLTYNSRVQGIISLSGATFDTIWVTSDDPPMMSMHGDADETLPYGYAREGAFNKVTLYGSSTIHERADNIGLVNYFEGVPNGGHTNIYSSAQFEEYLVRFNVNTLLIMQDIACDEISVSTKDISFDKVNIKIFPNPTRGSFIVEPSRQGNWGIYIYDSSGRLAYQSNPIEGNQLSVDDFSGIPGWYVVHVRENGVIKDAQILLVK